MRGRRPALVALGLLLAAGALGAQSRPPPPAARPRVAVLDFVFRGENANSIEPGDSAAAAAAGSRVREQLGAAGGGVELVDSAETAAAVVALGEPPARCAVSAVCAREVGRRLGARWVAAGRLSKTSNLVWYFGGRVVDVGAGRLLLDDEFELKGSRDEMVPRGALSLGRRMVRAVQRASGPAEAPAAAPDDAAAGALPRLTRDDVVAALAAATEARPADLSRRDLSGLELSGLDFKQANLSGSRLVGTRLARANLFGATLTGVSAADADFTGAVLDVAVMRDADLTRARLGDASLYATILIGATLADADLSRARVIAAMSGAKLPRATLVDARFGADRANQPMGLMRTDLTGADLTGANLRGADLRKADLTRADLSGADVTGTDVTGAELGGTILKALRGRDRLKGLDSAKNADKAVWN